MGVLRYAVRATYCNRPLRGGAQLTRRLIWQARQPLRIRHSGGTAAAPGKLLGADRWRLSGQRCSLSAV